MAGLVPAIHVFLLCGVESKTWMPGIKPGMTAEVVGLVWMKYESEARM
jgi:hypothetical protein